MHGRATLITIAVSVLALFQCEVFLSDYGADGQPCFGDGTCNEGHACTPDEVCCKQDCAGKRCDDDDGCGGTCGCSGATDHCNAEGQCVDDCAGRECGTSPNEGFDCGTCPGATDYCAAGGQCTDDCAGRECGTSPNEGFDCGTCSVGYSCCSGSCEDTVVCWVSIPGGSFMMGSDSGGSDEKPVHEVIVPAFEMTWTEVTVGQFQACVDAGACDEPSQCSSYNNWGVAGREDHPVNCVDWQQAVDFCEFAGGRLPSEAEWEYAARGGGQDITYPWGNESPSCTYAVMNDGGYGCGENRTWAVCSKTSGNTEQGLCDMAGNVWEWVQDWHHSDYNGAPSDGSAWEIPSGSSRVVRGGGFSYDAVYLRAAVRISDVPSYRSGYFGFRCARDAP